MTDPQKNSDDSHSNDPPSATPAGQSDEFWDEVFDDKGDAGTSSSKSDSAKPDVTYKSPLEGPVDAQLVDANSDSGSDAPPVLQQLNEDDEDLPNVRYVVSGDAGDRPFVEAVPVGDVELFRSNQAANGGAINSLILGVLTISGAFLTPWSLLNGLLGLFMGVWGLTSTKKRMASLGLLLCTVGMVLCFFPVTESISQAIEAHYSDAQSELEEEF